MNKILAKKILAENIIEYKLQATDISKNCQPGQFIILRVSEDGERVPFTICDFDRNAGTISIVVQTVGATTYELSLLNKGNNISDLVGPLGNATALTEFKSVLLVGGGIGSAVIYPQSKFLNSIGKKCDVIIGARDKSLIMYEDEFKKAARNLYIATDDGSYGKKGFVTDIIKELIESGKKYDCILAVGPLPMMRAVCNLTKQFGIHTIVSMNSVMVDGTGMCGCCRLSYDGNIKYACVDGPEFDGHKIDFDEAISRSRVYLEFEKEHFCNIRGNK